MRLKLIKNNLGFVPPNDWNVEKIGDFAEIKVGRDLKEDRFNESKTKAFKFPVYSNTVENFGLYGFYSRPEYSEKCVTVVGRGAGVGTAFKRDEPFGAIGRLLVLIPNEKVTSNYLKLFINDRVRFYNESTGVPQLTGVQVKTYLVAYPSIQEQEEIAKIISTWDEAISKTEKLIKAKKRYKKGLMQRLLSGKVQFPEFEGDDWVEVKLGDVFDRVTEKNESETIKNVLTISAQDGLVSQTDYYNKSVSSKDLSNYIVLKQREFAYNKSYSEGYPLGAIKRLDDYEKGVLSPLYICFKLTSDKVDSDFITHFFEYGGLDHGIYKIAREGARNHGLLNVSVKDFFDIDLTLPQYEEQKKIASILNVAMKEIELLEAQLEMYQQQKKGVMQLLLTGKVRVN